MKSRFHVACGDMREVLKQIPENSIDAIVTDPPYGLSFMGEGWDQQVPGPEYWREVLRVAKPGAHILAFSGTRTGHRLACALEDAGWELRDCLMWLYGSGFPKSHDISKAIDSEAGAEREQMLVPTRPCNRPEQAGPIALGASGMRDISAPVTPDAARWQGWGTALKPAWEPIYLARKPITGTVAANVLKYDTGAINVDGCRIGDADGRWPANLLLDEEAAAALDAQTGVLKTHGHRTAYVSTPKRIAYNRSNPFVDVPRGSNEGGASRFFYVAKASRSEREAGLDGFGATNVNDGRETSIDNPYQRGDTLRKNTHPTVKPAQLMQYLIRLICPPGGTVLDPFTGSGSTGIAAMREGARFFGVELNPEYVEIAKARIAHEVKNG